MWRPCPLAEGPQSVPGTGLTEPFISCPKNLEKQKVTGLEAPKLMLTALNGVPVARVSGREDGGARVPMDDRVSAALWTDSHPHVCPGRASQA